MPVDYNGNAAGRSAPAGHRPDRRYFIEMKPLDCLGGIIIMEYIDACFGFSVIFLRVPAASSYIITGQSGNRGGCWAVRVRRALIACTDYRQDVCR